MTPRQNERRRRRRPWAWLGLIAAVFCFAIPVILHVLSSDYAVERLKRQIRSEVPVGSTQEQVDAWAMRRLGAHAQVSGKDWPPELRGKTLPEEAGVPWDDLGSMMEVVVRNVGWYTVNGEAAHNNLFVFFTLDEAGRVKGHHFLSLEEMAAFETKRLSQRPPEPGAGPGAPSSPPGR